MSLTISPKLIYDKISETVIGQEDAKIAISNAVFIHYVKLFQRHEENVTTKSSNLLLLGPSGNGKTHMIRAAAQAVRDLTGYAIMPTLEIDSTTLTARGWEGEDLVDFLHAHNKKLKGSTKEIEFNSTIVFLDEFDKLCNPAVGKGGTDHNKKTQYSLLKALEGADLLHTDSRSTYSTHNMLFIMGGNFAQLRHNRKSESKDSIGFVDTKNRKILKNLHSELERAGVVTQVAGRIGVVAELNKLSRKDLKKILLEHTIPSRVDLFAFMNAEIKIPDSVINKIVKEAFDKNMGARGLDGSLDRYLEKQVFNLEFTR